MERRLKERLIGAAILVVLIVLVVPELLSGPKGDATKSANEAMRTVTVDLDTKREMALDAPAEGAAGSSVPSQPASAAQPTIAPAPAPAPRSAPVLTAPTPAYVPDAPASTNDTQAASGAPGASGKSWTLQLGSFASLENADHLVRSVKAHNSPAYLLKSGTGKSVRYRVRVGPLVDRAAADRMLAKLKSEGHAASLVAR